MSDIQLGTRWVAVRGPHAGNEVEVTRVNGSSVQVSPLGGGASWNNRKTKAIDRYTIREDVFSNNYRPAAGVLNGARGGGTSYRHVAETKPKAKITTLSVQPVLGLVSTGDSQLNIEVTTITPAMAHAWLERGGLNRKLSERRVQKLVGIIQRGEWELTGEGIMLRGDGTVGNGQHRLTAIERAGIAVQSVVIRNISDKAFDAIDTGGSRSVADVLSIHGYGNRISLASMTRALITIEATGRYVTNRRDLVTPARSLAYVQAHPEVEHTLRLAYQVKTAGLTGGAGLWAAALTLMWRVDADAMELFVQKLQSGAGLEAGDPILRLRNRVMAEQARQKLDQSEAGREFLLAIILKAWNFWRAGETIGQLTWHGKAENNPEAFPVAV